MRDLRGLESKWGFDNRTSLSKYGLSTIQYGLDRIANQGKNHFVVDLPSLRLGYCYIRKNACTSFKNMFMEMAPKAMERQTDQRPIDFMRQNMRLRRKDIATCDRLIFVYRDPIERVVSLYKNKFIVRNGNTNIFGTYEKLTGSRPEKASFQTFVTDYFKNDFSLLDRHVLPQQHHLYHSYYTDAVPMEQLHSRMRGAIGEELADKYFLYRSNASTTTETSIDFGDVSRTSSAELFDSYSKSGALPDNTQLLTKKLERELKIIFKDDIKLIEAIENS